MLARKVVVITPRGASREVFKSLDGNLLVPPEEVIHTSEWWRRRGIEPLVQRKAHPDVLQA